MSTYGGDSWVPEAFSRKRRVDELLSLDVPSSETARLSNGRLCCTVCPHNPILDSLATLLVHRKGKKHLVEAEKRKDEERWRQEMVEKRIALGSLDASFSTTSCPRYKVVPQTPTSSPLLEATKRSTSRILQGKIKSHGSYEVGCSRNSNVPKHVRCTPQQQSAAHVSEREQLDVVQGSVGANKISRPSQEAPDPYKPSERELQLRESGWKRDAFGGWFKEENVEFDSDEEAPSDI